jgi:hypothetical protein
MLWQIKKLLKCHFPALSQYLSQLEDPRKGEFYTIEELVMSSIVLFLLKCESRNDFNLKQRSEQFQQNYKRMFGLRPPHMDAVNDLFEKISTEPFEELRCQLISSFIEKRVFHGLRFFDKIFCIGIDATGVYDWGDEPPEAIKKHAIKKEYSSSKENYSNQVFEAVIICKNGMSIPLMTEWVANGDEKYDKQDCELNAFKRLSVRLKEQFPRLNICILADGLYSNVSLMNICQQYGWKSISVFKDGNLPSVWVEVESLLPLDACETKEQIVGDKTHWIKYKYRWLNNIEYQKHMIHRVECVIESEHRKTGEKTSNRFVFLTNIDVDAGNVAQIISAGRARWHIEDHFNTQKNRGGALHHKFNRKDFKAIRNWHSVRQLAWIMIEFVEYSVEIQKMMKDEAKMTSKELWQNIKAYLTMCSVDDTMKEFEQWSISPRQVRLE